MPLVKVVDPAGNLLGDTDKGVDYLGESVYADAIAESIHNSETSITIGIYAERGSGKSFLLRHIEGILKRYEKQGKVDGEQHHQASETEYSCKKACKLCPWIILLIVIFGVIALSLTLAVRPDLFVPGGASQTATTTQLTTTSTNQSASQEEERIDILRKVGMGLLPAELLLIFIIGCCSRKTTPGCRYDRFNILTYGIFTKIPMQDLESEIVEDPGQKPADVLKYDPGNERLATASTRGIAYPRKYIFVNFKTWEYAGSDTLWAAIVTNISDAIEDEFGRITTRLFRMLTIQKPDNETVRQEHRTLYIQFKRGSTQGQIRGMIERYGVVTSLKPTQKDGAPGFQYWEITYSNDGECRNAKDSLKIEGVKVSTKTHRSNEQIQRPLHGEEIPLNSFDVNSESDTAAEDQDLPTPRLDVLSRICCCCSSFCQHFVRHPVMLWKLPKLFWWILLPVCFLLIPVTVYIVASSLNLDVERTYREIPLLGQVLLWLPAGAAVTLAISKFVWAMCHSQRQRINRALDGTKCRMASQLGFMSKVKNEVEVMTNLIRCARFIHQTDYRVIITIDNLEQVEIKKVYSVLEAMNILLSDRSSPFVCIVAVDPRIAANCVEECLGKAMKNARFTGREYLKKIINLPICLPEITELNKKRYIAGLIDQSDQTVTYRVEERRNGKNIMGRRRAVSDVVDGASAGGVTDGPSETELSHKKFLYEARRFLYNDKKLHSYLHGNARSMKRIYNVISMTSNIINSIVKKQERQSFMRTNVKTKHEKENPAVEEVPKLERTKVLAEDIVMWIILVDQWPYRTSYIIQVIEDSQQRVDARFADEIIPDDCSIREIFQNKVRSNLENPDEDLLALDDDPDLFDAYLMLLTKRGFTKDGIVFLLRLTINLDYSIRRRIAFGSRPSPPPQEANETTRKQFKTPSLGHVSSKSSSSSSFSSRSHSLHEDRERSDADSGGGDTVF